MLTNPVYKGYAHWTPTGKVKRNSVSADTIVVKSDHEPIISPDFFDNVQNIIKERKKIHRKYYKGVNPNNIHWLNGLLRCSNCGCTLVMSTDGTLRCNGYAKGKCSTSQSVKRDIIEQAIIEQLNKDFTKEISPVERIEIISEDTSSTYIAQLKKYQKNLLVLKKLILMV